MEITQSRIEPDITVVAPAGRLTLGRETLAFENMVADLIAKGAQKVILDMTQLAYVDSAGLGVLLQTASKLKQAGGGLRLANVGTRVMQVIKMTHTDSVLPSDVDVKTSATQF
jgi:anti-sigma B factor antagonist